jgi:hypothetical protein
VTQIFGFAAVARAADRAAAQPGPDPVPQDEPCPLLVSEYQAFSDDPITSFYGVESECGPLVTRQHVARHHCQGWGRA